MRIADSSFLVSLFLPNDKNHTEAKQLFSSVQDRIFVPNIIIYETLTVINYKGGSDEKREAHAKLLRNQSFVIDTLSQEELHAILDEFLSHNNDLSFPDVTVIYLARRSRSSVLAFDKGILGALL